MNCMCVECVGNRENEERLVTEANSGVVPGSVYKGWFIEYMPKPGRPGLIDWDATHPDEETCFNGKTPADLQDQIDAFLDT